MNLKNIFFYLKLLSDSRELQNSAEMRIFGKSNGTWERVVFTFLEIIIIKVLKPYFFAMTFSSRFHELKGAKESTELSRLYFLITNILAVAIIK
jgi:hypothetical protein